MGYNEVIRAIDEIWDLGKRMGDAALSRIYFMLDKGNSMYGMEFFDRGIPQPFFFFLNKGGCRMSKDLHSFQRPMYIKSTSKICLQYQSFLPTK